MHRSLLRILVVDDDPVVCATVCEALTHIGYHIDSARNGSDASSLFSRRNYSIVLCDILLPDTNGLELMAEIKKINPDTFVILFTGHASVDLAKEAIKQGAFDFITKPFTIDEITEALRRAENEQRSYFSDISSASFRTLYELTVSDKVTAQTKVKSLKVYAEKTMASFAADSLRIYLQDEQHKMLEKIIAIGQNSLADEVTWYFLAQRTMQSGSEVLLEHDDYDTSVAAGTDASFMGTVIPTDKSDLGVILAGREGWRDCFKTRDLKLLGLYAAQLGSQLQTLRITNDLVRNNKELEKINLITSGFASSLDTQAVFHTVLSGLSYFISFDVAAIFAGLNDSSSLNYIYVNQNIPYDRLFDSLGKQISKNFGPEFVPKFLSNVHIDTFVAKNILSFENRPEFTFTKLDDYAKLRGWLMMASWTGRSKLLTQSRFFPILLRHAATAICSSLQYRENQNNYFETIAALAQAVDAKDEYTNHHSINVTAYAVALADKLKLTGAERKNIMDAAILHDIGKIGIPEAILNKPGKLTDDEYDIIKTHPAKGCAILKPIEAFKELLPAIRHHHERYDGSGYPDGLGGTDIPYSARILSVADSFDAMTSSRVYRKSPGVSYALEQLAKYSGTQFDPNLSSAFIELIREKPYRHILKSYSPDVKKPF